MDRLELAIVRRAYAKQVLAIAGVNEPRMESAFSAVSREHFLGAGPWQIFRWWSGCYVPTPDADPVYLYTNDVVGIDVGRRINNGEPSWHAVLIAAALPQPGEHVVHVGAGVGYYTAILAHLVGPDGRVTGIECAPDLAPRAKANLAHLPQVEIREGDGTTIDFVAGRSLAQVSSSGAVFRIERRAEDYAARCISTVAVFPYVGGRDAEAEAALVAAFEKGSPQAVTRLYRTGEMAEERCWLKGEGWCLAYG